MSGWPNPGAPGIPLHPERDGLHYITDAVALWWAYRRKWSLLGRSRDVPAEWLADQPWATYLGPCATPAEVAAQVAQARREGAQAMREAAAMAVPGGAICDPQDVADAIRAIPLPDAAP